MNEAPAPDNGRSETPWTSKVGMAAGPGNQWKVQMPGFNYRKRIAQWIDVLREEHARLSFPRLAWDIGRVVIQGLVRYQDLRRQWRMKMRKCGKCPVYDKKLRRCRPYTGSILGCGCFMVFAALFKKHGWGTETMPEKLGKYCW